MMLDLNDAQKQRPEGLIPDGTFCALRATIRPGDFTLPNMDAADAGLFKKSKSSDVVMVDFEFTVLSPGPHAKRKFWQAMTVAGGQTDEKGVPKGWNVTMSTLRAMAESALGVSAKDTSPEAQAKRRLPNFKSFDGFEFIAKVGIAAGSAAPDGGLYPDKNKLAHIVTPDEPEWATIRQGSEVAPRPAGVARANIGALQAKLQQQPQPKPAGQEGSQPAVVPAKGPAWLNG